MTFDLEKIKEIFKKYKYYPTEELLWRTYINLQKSSSVGNVGQDIYAICLEGPPGSGKSEYAKVYTKILSELSDGSIEVITKNLNEKQENKTEFLRYTCNPSTGKETLYEDIRISSAIVGKNDDVIIPGILIEAIKQVKDGKKVVLFLDEYDKAKAETDGFLLEFLQDGRLFTTQMGEIQLTKEEAKNLQVILCKNDSRAELSGPLARRLNIIRLEHMKPELMIQITNDKMSNADNSIKTLVTLLYNLLYTAKDEFKRLPSVPEVMMAIQEADILKNASAPTKYIYRCIITNIIKSEMDLYSFEKLINKNQDLNKQILSFKEIFNKNLEDFNGNIYQIIYDSFFKGQVEETSGVQQSIQPNEINLDSSNGEIASTYDSIPAYLQEINIDTSNDFICGNISVGESKSKFDSSEKWYKIGAFEIPAHLQHTFIEKASEVKYDGPVLYQDNNYGLIAVKKTSQNSKNIVIEFYASSLVMPTMALIKLKDITTLADNKSEFGFDFLTLTQFRHIGRSENGLVHISENNKITTLSEIFSSIGEVKVYSLMDKTILFDTKNFKVQNFGKNDVATNNDNNKIKVPLENDSNSITETIASLYSIPFKTSAVARNRAYGVLTPTNEHFVRTINYQAKNWSTTLDIIDLNAVFETAKTKNDQIARQINIEFSGATTQVKMPQKIFRRVN